jgi:hypothetical protein
LSVIDMRSARQNGLPEKPSSTSSDTMTDEQLQPPMDIVFSAKIPALEAASPGELYLVLTGVDAQRRDLASFVVAHGTAKLLQGQGPVERIVVPCDTTRPTFDDMLAASFVERLLQNEKLPVSAAAYARYAALAREGLQPGNAPLDTSMEGIFLAIRDDAGNDLTNPASAVRFLGEWRRLAGMILAAADAGKDPFSADIFGGSSDFARERAFLRKDQDVYREDVRRGKQWIVQLPGGPPSSAMLLLETPRSLLWKYWSRRDTSAPAGGSYLLLVVNWGQGNWVISTDPVQRLGIKSLAERLQAAESRDHGDANADPWFDGAPFGHTLVAAPRAGTRLSHREVLTIIKKWAKAKSATHLNRLQKIGAVVGGTLLTVITAVAIQVVTSRLLQSQPKPSEPASTSPTTHP